MNIEDGREMQLEGATVSFEWRFVGLADGRTRLAQRIVLKGQRADKYLSHVKAAFTANLLVGINKLAKAMANADPRHKSSSPE